MKFPPELYVINDDGVYYAFDNLAALLEEHILDDTVIGVFKFNSSGIVGIVKPHGEAKSKKLKESKNVKQSDN